MASSEKKLTNLVYFSPQHWGELQRFVRLYHKTYQFDERTLHILHGVVGHFHKATTLLRVAHTMSPHLKEDIEELNAKGHSSGKRGSELAAIGETVFCELYSAIGCARHIISEIYRGYQGVTSNKTRTFFQNAFDRKLDERLPLAIREACQQAQWFNELRRLRDAVIHSDVGSCHLDESTGKIRYLQESLRVGEKAFFLDDFFEKMESFYRDVNLFLGKIFRVLNQTLKDDEVWQMCGVFNSLIYTRFVRPAEAIDFNSGRCDALTWFEKEGNKRCPLADNCGAYKKAKELSSA
jgi:hypothetical protein